MSSYRVLVVDDQGNEARSFADMIEAKTGLHCAATDDPEEAARIAETSPLTVLVLDQSMPRLSGTELYQHLKHLVPYGAALMLTQEDDAAAAGMAMRLGYKERLHKANIDDLPGLVLRLHIEATSNLARSTRPVTLFHRSRWPFGARREITLVSFDLLDGSFVDSNEWTEFLSINAGQESKVSRQETFTRTLTFEGESTESISAEVGVSAAKLSGKLASTLLERTRDSYATSTTAVHLLEDSFRLPQEPSDPNEIHVRMRRFDYAPVYRRFRVVVMTHCGKCDSRESLAGIVRLPTETVALRQVDYLSDRTVREHLTGTRRLPLAASA
ncbi:response regulator [Dactylosporangium sp. NPDC006015]|uniref:response regulator transcription factor n=1 Tax=Dactylosporangium sp. NPDC006015 TaxID=3154576 RepID=UPI0033ADC7A3